MIKPAQNFGAFYIVKELGAGTFGRVWHGLRIADGIPVAIKLLEERSDDSTRRFIREARLLSQQLDNPYVVDILGADLEHEPPYLVMEYCDGGSLRSWVENLRPWRDVAAALLHAAQGLAAIHKAQGFHRDIKPDNLLISRNEQRKIVIKIADFGLAQAPSDDSVMTNYGRGTPAYIAPEVHRTGTFSHPADVFALGVTGIELLTGQRDQESLNAIQCPDAMKTLLVEMTGYNPNKRPSIADVVQRLAAFLQEQRQRSHRPATPGANGSSTGQSKGQSGDLAGLLLTGGLVVGGLALLARMLDGNDDEDDDDY